MRKYTEKIHAERTMKMFEKEDPCMLCPAGKRYQTGWEEYAEFMWSDASSPCGICQEFVNTDGCPCITLGEREAIKRTWIVLEKKGYISSTHCLPRYVRS